MFTLRIVKEIKKILTHLKTDIDGTERLHQEIHRTFLVGDVHDIVNVKGFENKVIKLQGQSSRRVAPPQGAS